MSHAVVVGGYHSVEALLSHAPERVLELWIIKSDIARLQPLITLAERQHIAVQLMHAERLDQLCESALVHQGVGARCHPLESPTEAGFLQSMAEIKRPLLLALDGIQDPRNLGACLRSASVFGVDGIILPRNRAADLTPVARKAACGAAELIPIVRVTNLVRTLLALKENGVWVVGFSEYATTSLSTCDLGSSACMVLGNEGDGMRRLTRETCDQLVSIPAFGILQSLNVSVACGVALYAATSSRNRSIP